MGYKNIVDLHTHTDNSYDGHHSTMFLCETACTKGIRAIAFTDHIEIDAFHENHFERTAIQSFFEIIKAKSAFKGKLLVCTGVELGQATYDRAVAEKLIGTMNYDIVIGSIHNLRDKTDPYCLDYNDESIDYMDIIQKYFEYELELTQWGKFDTLAHMTYPLRYIVGDYGKPVDMSRFADIIDEILLALIKNEKSLEINTSGLRMKLGRISPDEAILKRYKALGGRLITIGSDAHYSTELGSGIEEGYDLALRCGFDKIAIYQNRTPTLMPIE